MSTLKTEYRENGIRNEKADSTSRRRTLTDFDRECFDEGLKLFCSHRHFSRIQCYDIILANHYSRKVERDGQIMLELTPERPTYRQFTNYVNKHLTPEQKKRASVRPLKEVPPRINSSNKECSNGSLLTEITGRRSE